MPEDFTLTQAAAARIVKLMELEHNPSLKLRVTVSGGGCSGFKYQFSLDSSTLEHDRVYSLNGASVVIDELSLDLLKGSVLDFEEDLGSATFTIKNPNITARCGCGSSFSM